MLRENLKTNRQTKERKRKKKVISSFSVSDKVYIEFKHSVAHR